MALPIDIFSYYNYRDFLRDYYDARKARDRNFSYRWFAMRAGFNSSGLYSSIVQGKVNLTDNTTPKFALAMKLTTREERYFELMVEFTHATTPDARQEIFDRMLPLMPRRMQKAKANQKEYYTSWHYTAVHQALATLDVRDNYEKLAAKIEPQISIADARKAVKLLAELGLVEKNSSGYWKSTTQGLMGGGEVGVDLIHRYQIGMMQLAEEALARFSKEERHISTTTVSISSEGKERILKKLADTQKEIFEIVRSDTGENQVWQLNLQFFPMTHRPEEE